MKIEKVEAFKITKDNIYFFCPYCEDKNLVDPYRKYCDIHIHGSNNNLFNRIRAAYIGTQFDSTNYISYVERSQVSISPDLDTEHLESMSIWGDGGTAATVGGELQPATLRVR